MIRHFLRRRRLHRRRPRHHHRMGSGGGGDAVSVVARGSLTHDLLGGRTAQRGKGGRLASRSLSSFVPSFVRQTKQVRSVPHLTFTRRRQLGVRERERGRRERLTAAVSLHARNGNFQLRPDVVPI